ncbi:threonine aldolase family protein [Granulicatella seriolae]|uniref:Aminotransferase class I/II-fold pyridoxal phosphate-dependent enzyme n=1 Tax=Granulicatella seriolae TaxID=2967226 RepID=A0ABT1WLZ9_9LACT|nr:aminotransferase class I/II-fold pyridoxal phosphate-dependent enzyme [Granulicatella seriolae]
MTSFGSDYLEGCHPAIMEALIETNFEQTAGYGMDPYSKRASQRIMAAVGQEKAQVHFFVGGTQVNKTVIASVLRPYQGVVSAKTGHIAEHETGAIEASGHKVLELPSLDGKITANQLETVYQNYKNSPVQEHIVQPGMVYLSHPTELGTVYQKKELEEIAQVCQKAGWPLFLDGARLAYALDDGVSDLTLSDIAQLCDLFYIGGTKCGALFGEALVIVNPSLQGHFRAMMKQGGGLLAKGRLLGIQFDQLFKDDLYYQVGKKALFYSRDIRRAFENRGIEFYGESTTNQQFPILNANQADYFINEFGFALWEVLEDGRVVTRYCTSWATKPHDVKALIESIEGMDFLPTSTIS